MNSNELMKDLYKVLKTSGWLDKATKYFREHPEKFDDCAYGDGKIASVSMSVSYQPESLSAVADAEPNVFISIGNMSTDEREFNVYSNGTVRSLTWIDNKLVISNKLVINDAKVINDEINMEERSNV